MSTINPENPNYLGFSRRVKDLASSFGFSSAVISSTVLSARAQHDLHDWLAQGCHGEMAYMARNVELRDAPAQLVEGCLSIISVRMPYLGELPERAWSVLEDGKQAYISRYALGRDYHKVLRQRLKALAEAIEQEVGVFGWRVFTDSAPIREVELASGAGLGWRGKHTLLIDRQEGSFFFLGEIFTTLPLPPDAPVAAHCGRCTQCIDCCPTQAIIAPYRVDARRCISYLTIEHFGSIPEALRASIGNRIYGCDDCQLVCPWNRFAKLSVEKDFQVRHQLDRVSLVELFAWSEHDFAAKMAGSPIFRIGYERWLRNVAVGLGNAPTSVAVIQALSAHRHHASALVREHVGWALAQHGVL